jgi:retron-type reverse transcriptase
MRTQFIHSFENIISAENLLEAWKEFIKSKRGKQDVQEFSLRLMDNIFLLHKELINNTYKHGGYQAFSISDPKPRSIHKAIVRDRLLHHATYRILYPFFDRVFIADSYSCRLNKGTHKALNRFRAFSYKVSRNNTRTCWILKCDIRKFFASIDQAVLMEILGHYVVDKDVLDLLQEVIGSFSAEKQGVGLPLGNLTSQLLANIYMNELDQFMKQQLKVKYYMRYADDFVILSPDKKWLEDLLPIIREFLSKRLRLELHPNKVFLKTLYSGVDFLGWVHFPDHRVLRTATKKRMMKKVRGANSSATFVSYEGLLGHGNTKKLRNEVRRNYLLKQAAN